MSNRFLLIDDDADDRSLFSEALALVDPVIVVEEAADGEEAFSHLSKRGNADLDLIFLDINLPVMNGWQFLTKLKGSDVYRDIPVVIYSTSSSSRDMKTAQDLGALCFVTKPHAFRSLQSILKVVVKNVEAKSLATMCDEIHALKAS